jgi:NADPH:quinone reductase-like Zn-dependent oxidoreductase
MRIPSPHVAQDAPTNPRGTLAAKWYAAVNEKKSEDSTTTTSVKSSSRTSLSDNQISSSSSDNKSSSQQATKTLGTFLVKNHGALNQIIDFEDLSKKRQQQHNNLHNYPSLTSSQEMERAETRFSGEEDPRSKSFSEDEEKVDTHSIHIRQQQRIKNRQQYQSHTDAPAPAHAPRTEHREERYQSHAPKTEHREEQCQPRAPRTEHLEEREAPPVQIRYWDDETPSTPSASKRSAFQSLIRRPTRTVPIKALADASLLSPQSCATSPDEVKQFHRPPPAPPQPAPAPQVVAPSNPSVGPLTQQTSSFWELLKPINFLQRPCAPLSPVVPLTSVARSSEEAGNKSESNNFWSYLDPNDDLRQYDDHDNTADDSSAEYFSRKNRRKSSSSRKSKTPASSRKAKTPETTRTSSRPKTQQQQQQHKQLPPQDALSQAYEALMSLNPNKNDSQNRHPEKSQTGSHSNSSTPNTLGDRSSTYTHSTVQITPDPGYGRESPTLTDIHDDLWGPPRDEHSHTVQSDDTPQKRQSPTRDQEDPRTTTRSDPAPPRVRVTVTKNTISRPSSRPKSREHLPPKRPMSRGKDQQRSDYEAVDAYRRKEQSRSARAISDASQQHEPNSPHASTPRAFNRDGFETTAAFSLHHREPPTPNGEARQQQTSKTSSPRELQRQTRTKSSSQRKRVSSEESNDNGGLFSFTPDLYMLEALHKEITGVPIEMSMQQGLPVIDVGDGDDPRVSNLSDGSSTRIREERKIKKKLDLAKWRSMKNLEKLQELERQHKNRIPTHLPGAPPSVALSKDGLDSFEAADYANCMAGVERRVERGVSKMGHRLGLKNNYEPSEASNSVVRRSRATTPKPLPVEQPGGVIPNTLEDIEGHYMYVAYSRFGGQAREVLQLCEHESFPTPNHRNGEVLVKVMASIVSPTDCEIRRGEWSEVRLNPYIIPGVAFVGTIHHKEKSTAFSKFKPGDMVMSLVKTGSNARYMCIAKDRLVKVPQTLDPDMTVCLSETYLSAFQALHLGQRGAMRYRNNSLKGQSILVMAGHSSLGRALIELALAGGADFCYASAKKRQFESISRIGAIPLSRDPQDWLTLIGRQIGTIVTVKDGGLYTEQITKEHLKALNADGQVVFIGQPGVDNSIPESSPSPAKLMCKSHRSKLSDRSQSYNVFDSWGSDPKQCKLDLEHLLSLLEQRRLLPEVLERIPLSKVAKAQSIVESKRVSGHIVCLPWIKETLQH